MLRLFTDRLLPVLQFTRFALVFTAIADGFCSLMLWNHLKSELFSPVPFDYRKFLASLAISVGLYGFGMSLNDLIDRRRDAQTAPNRPLPSGRMNLRFARTICISLALLAGLGAFAYFKLSERDPASWMTLLLLVFTLWLIVFYDMAGKYLVAPGLLTLGLIRFFHACIVAPLVPLLWHPLILFNHVAILSMVCYTLEEKRPQLTRVHYISVWSGILAMNAFSIGLLAHRRMSRGLSFEQALWIDQGLLYPAIAVVVFILLAMYLRKITPVSRLAGQKIMLAGLLWLIVYDAAFVAGYVSFAKGGILLLLLPCAYGSVLLMRSAAKLVSLTRPPEFKRAQS